MTVKTTNLAIIRKDPDRFIWGALVCIHEIGRYTIVASDDMFNRGPNVVTERKYHCYVDGDTIQRAASNIDEAMVICLAHGRLDGGQEADSMAKAALKLLTPTP